MRILLDTHICLWALTDDRRLGKAARRLLTDPDNALFVSAASVWEIAIKRTLPRHHLPFGADDAIRYFTQAGYILLPIRAPHAAAVEQLASHHADPFDRLLIAQAQTEPLRLMTHDAILARYSDAVILV